MRWALFGFIFIAFLLGLDILYEFYGLILLIFVHIFMYFTTKKDLSAATVYVRLSDFRKQRNIHFALIAIIVTLLWFFGDLHWLEPRAEHLTVVSISLTLTFGDGPIANFSSGIRFFREGFKLPGHYAKLITWNHLEKFEIDGEYLVLRTNLHGEKRYLYKREDKEDLHQMIHQWKATLRPGHQIQV